MGSLREPQTEGLIRVWEGFGRSLKHQRDPISICEGIGFSKKIYICNVAEIRFIPHGQRNRENLNAKTLLADSDAFLF